MAQRGERIVTVATWASRNNALGKNHAILNGLRPRCAPAALPRFAVRGVLCFARCLADSHFRRQRGSRGIMR
jgi:hypothetical protein